MVRYLLHLTALFGFSVAAVGQSSRNGNPIPVFQAGYLDNNYRIVYLLENETIIAVERINEKETGKEFLQFESAGKNSFATLQIDIVAENWIALKIKSRQNQHDSSSQTGQRIYEEIRNGKDGKKTILIDTKHTLCREIYYRFANQTECETSILGYPEDKGPNAERDYEKGIQITTGNGPNFSARFNIIPDQTVVLIASERKKTIRKESISAQKNSKNPSDVALIGMYYFAQNPPEIEEASRYFELAYSLLPKKNMDIKDGIDIEIFRIINGKNSLEGTSREQLISSFSQDPLLVIQKLLDKEQLKNESVESRNEKNRTKGKDNPVTTRKVVPVPLTNNGATAPTSSNKVVIRRRVTPYKKTPDPTDDFSTNPQQNP
jgi:hypothetical protein